MTPEGTGPRRECVETHRGYPANLQGPKRRAGMAVLRQFFGGIELWG